MTAEASDRQPGESGQGLPSAPDQAPAGRGRRRRTIGRPASVPRTNTIRAETGGRADLRRDQGLDGLEDPERHGGGDRQRHQEPHGPGPSPGRQPEEADRHHHVDQRQTGHGEEPRGRPSGGPARSRGAGGSIAGRRGRGRAAPACRVGGAIGRRRASRASPSGRRSRPAGARPAAAVASRRPDRAAGRRMAPARRGRRWSVHRGRPVVPSQADAPSGSDHRRRPAGRCAGGSVRSAENLAGQDQSSFRSRPQARSRSAYQTSSSSRPSPSRSAAVQPGWGTRRGRSRRTTRPRPSASRTTIRRLPPSSLEVEADRSLRPCRRGRSATHRWGGRLSGARPPPSQVQSGLSRRGRRAPGRSQDRLPGRGLDHRGDHRPVASSRRIRAISMCGDLGRTPVVERPRPERPAVAERDRLQLGRRAAGRRRRPRVISAASRTAVAVEVVESRGRDVAERAGRWLARPAGCPRGCARCGPRSGPVRSCMRRAGRRTASGSRARNGLRCRTSRSGGALGSTIRGSTHWTCEIAVRLEAQRQRPGDQSGRPVRPERTWRGSVAGPLIAWTGGCCAGSPARARRACRRRPGRRPAGGSSSGCRTRRGPGRTRPAADVELGLPEQAAVAPGAGDGGAAARRTGWAMSPGAVHAGDQGVADPVAVEVGGRAERRRRRYAESRAG